MTYKQIEWKVNKSHSEVWKLISLAGANVNLLISFFQIKDMMEYSKYIGYTILEHYT